MNKKKKLTRSETMSRIRSKDTRIEIALRKALWAEGLRYRKNDKTVFGKPDIVFKGKKIAIFCDSKFWHGYDYLYKGKAFNTNPTYWEAKMKRNIARDQKVNDTLRNGGWIVLRYWEDDILKNLEAIINEIKTILDEQRSV